MFDQIGNLSPIPPTSAPPVPSSRAAQHYAAVEWDIPRVKQALRFLDAGSFAQAVELRDFIRRDPRAAGAEGQLADTFLGFRMGLEAAPNPGADPRMEAVRAEAEGLFGASGVTCGPELLRELIEDLAGFFFKPCWLHFEPSPDGVRWTPRLTPWPLEAVERDPADPSRYVALTSSGERIPIEGEHWITFRRAATRNHRRGAVRTIAESWINRAFALGDWGIASASNAPKRIGELPAEVSVDSPEGRQFAADLARLDQPYSGMIHRAGGKVSTHKPSELAHKIHLDLASLSASDYSIAYLGQDGTMSLGTSGTYGARQVLHGVAYDVIRGMSTGIVSGLNELLRRWAVYNSGRDVYPRACVEVPDLEAEQARGEAIKRRAPMLDELDRLAKKGPLTRELCTTIARRYGQEMSEEEIAHWTRPGAADPSPKEIP